MISPITWEALFVSSDRPTNPELVASFRALLTTEFRIEGELACSDLMNSEQERDEVLRVTKAWRAELWNAFHEIEARLCPLEVETRRRQKEAAK